MSNHQLSLSDVLYAFSLEQDKPTAALLEEYRNRFPQYADDITEFVMELAIDALRSDVPDLDAETVAAPASAEVMRSVSDFQNARHQTAQERFSTEPASAENAQRASPVNPFGALTATQSRRLVKEIDANLVLVAKLRDRQIVAETIPAAFSQRIAAGLGVSLGVVLAHLSAEPKREFRGVYFMAIDKPAHQPQQSFADAVRTSGLTLEQQERLLKL